ncbi:uncharacterized protein LOC130979014 [Arachis stenosperma]|uniref:uncharacterized protein LOC130979014 n=1 Tax=Arachis stenosperma TaxID=217475 RepID=UPI0025AC130B|nr:uncharacterized protein LOC130979014 [Arachis stenosperma]
MGGLLHLFEFNQGRMAKKVHAHKRHQGGLEAPRNSLDLQLETSQYHCPEGELPIAYDYQVEEDWSENIHCGNMGSMKKLINEELSKRSTTKQNAPSLVARLMGIDTMPPDTKSVVPLERTSEIMGTKFSKREMNGRDSVSRGYYNFNSSSEMELDSFYGGIDDDDGWSQSFGKPRPREHPQEEELQKFKKEFEAYQAARFLECSKVAEIDSIPRRLLPQENLNKENLTHDTSSHRTTMEKLAELDSHLLKSELPDIGGPEYGDEVMELIPAMQKKSFPSRSRTLSRDFEESLIMKSYHKFDRSSSPTRIVVLKPGLDSICNHEDSWTGSSGTLQGRNSIADFLEEVKERLKSELQGRTVKKGSVVRGSGIETRYNEKPADPKLIAQHIAKQVRESATRDVEANLFRSESTRSYKNDMLFNGPSSPEFINRDTRRFSSERLRNIGKSEMRIDLPEVTSRNSAPHALVNHRVRQKQTEDKCSNATSHWKVSKGENEMQTGSFRHDPDDNVLFQRDLSPRNLVRSLSAPVSGSGTSFGKLLLEDRHVLTGAQIRRKLEAVETISVDVKKQKKDRFNIKEKVSHFRYSLGLRGRLFGKRIQSMVESHGNEYGSMVRDVTSGPTVLLTYGERHENSTEVPPSPASVCSSVHEEFWKRAEYLSPLSTPDVSSRDDNIVPQVFRDISSGLSELRRQLNQLESNGSDDMTTKQEPLESEIVQLEDPAESFIRDLLVASGLYFGSWDKSLLRGDSLAKPIGNLVFKEVEASGERSINENDEGSIKDRNENMINKRVLLDLLNEALSVVLGPSLTLSRFRRKVSNTSMMMAPPCGKELLKSVWEIISASLYPQCDEIYPYSLDDLVAQHLGSVPWSGLVSEEINVLERDIECMITNDLVEELTKDMLLFRPQSNQQQPSLITRNSTNSS